MTCTWHLHICIILDLNCKMTIIKKTSTPFHTQINSSVLYVSIATDISKFTDNKIWKIIETLSLKQMFISFINGHNK